MTRIDHYNDPHAPKANNIKVAVSAFVQNANSQILMIHRTDNDMFSIPGGGQEVGETVAQAVAREVEEETGILVEVTQVIGVYSDPNHVIAYDDGEVRQEFSICFRAKPIGGELRTSNESKQVKWVPPEQLSDFDIHPSIRLRIDHGLWKIPEPYFT